MKLTLSTYVELFRGTPIMAQVVFIYHGLLPILGTNMSIWGAVYFILSISTGVYIAETTRGGVLSIDPGQAEGAKVIGMTHIQIMLHMILPQAPRNIMPQIGNNLTINTKDSYMLSVISVTEPLYKTRATAGALYMNFEAYTIAMIIHFIVTFTCSRILRWQESRMGGAGSYDLTTTDTPAHTSGMYRFPNEKDKKREDTR